MTRGLNEKETKSYNVDVARSLTRRQHLMFVFQRATWTFLWRGFVQAESCVAYAAKGKKKKNWAREIEDVVWNGSSFTVEEGSTTASLDKF